MVADKKLVKFLKDNIHQHTLANIKKELLKQGWKDEQIDEAAEIALHSHEKVSDLLNVGKEDLIPGKIQDIKVDTSLERTPVEHPKDVMKLFLFMGVGIVFIVGMVFGSYVLLTGDEDVIAEKIIDPQPINSANEAVLAVSDMFDNFEASKAEISEATEAWTVCYEEEQVKTCCVVTKSDGVASCNSYVL